MGKVDGGKGGVAAVEGAFVSLLFFISDNHFFATAFLVGEKSDIQNNWVVVSVLSVLSVLSCLWGVDPTTRYLFGVQKGGIESRKLNTWPKYTLNMSGRIQVKLGKQNTTWNTENDFLFLKTVLSSLQVHVFPFNTTPTHARRLLKLFAFELVLCQLL